ncbi:MAG: SAF domain-containing protein [Anaerolineales bacterium]
MGRRIFEAVAGIILLVVAFVAAYFFQQAYKSGVEYRALPVPVEDIPPYTVLTEKMFELKDFPSALIGGYANTLSQLTGRMTNSRIPAGLPIPLVLISAPEEYRLADPSLEVLSIPVSPPSTIGGQVRTGDNINIYRLITPGSLFIPLGEKDPVLDPVTLIAESIPVVMVIGDTARASASSTGGQITSAKILILAVTAPQRDAILNLMAEINAGAIMWITLAPVKA